jgi:hypothetical protein
MKGRDVVSGSLVRYLDQELCGQEVVEFRAHLEECPAWRQEIEADEELKSRQLLSQ